MTAAAVPKNEFKHKVLTLLNKLADRDTYTAAVAELDSIAKNLNHDSIPPFLSSITATDSADKSLVRKQCVRLISTLSESHANLLSPYLSKLISFTIRRLRDSDSAVRTACVAAISSVSSRITKPPFALIAKPLVDALVTEQELNSQIGAALCVAAAIDGSPEPDAVFLRRLLPRLEKLLRSESFKAKAALLSVFGSVIGAGGGGLSEASVRNLVKCLCDFVCCEDWAARKAAAEALRKLAVVERDLLRQYKGECLQNFEAKRFDKVKVVRETMNEMVEAWRQVPEASGNVTPPPTESHSSSREVASDGRYPPGSKTSRGITSGTPMARKKHSLASGSALRDYSLNSRKSSLPELSNNKTGSAMFRKLDRKKPGNQNVDTGTPVTVLSGYSKDKDENLFNKSEDMNRFTKLEMRRALFTKNTKEIVPKFEGSKASSRMFPYHAEVSGCTTVASNITDDLNRSRKECEDLSLIRNQLLQIEKQQSSLFDLLQGYIGSSKYGMRSLESRVHGLELALDKIKLDLAVSTGRMSNTNSSGATCFKLPVAGFLRSKLWRRTDARHLTSRFNASGATSSVAAIGNMADKNGNNVASRFRLQGGSSGFIVNPLAQVHNDSQGISEASSQKVSNNVHIAV